MCTEAKDSLIPKSQRQTAALYTICKSMNETKEFQKGFAPLTCKIMRMNGFVEQIWVDIGYELAKPFTNSFRFIY